MKNKLIIFITLLHISFCGLGFNFKAKAEEKPQIYIIDKISIKGGQTIDSEVIIELSGLKVGEAIRIPGTKISDAITKIWQQKIVDNISIEVDKINGSKISLIIRVSEKSRLIDYKFSGISDSDEEAIIEKLGDPRGLILSRVFLKNLKKTIKNYFAQKGYLLAEVEITETKDLDIENGVIIDIKVKKKKCHKVHKIYVKGNKIYTLGDIKHKMITTKERGRPGFVRRICTNIISLKAFQRGGVAWKSLKKSEIIDEVSSKMSNLTGTTYKDKTFETDREKLVKELYYQKGYIDASIVNYEIKQYDKQSVDIYIDIREGPQYYLGNIKWVGNKLFKDDLLYKIFKIKTGQYYNQVFINQRLFYPQDSVHALYRNDGYLFSRVKLRKSKVLNNVIDLEIDITEGEQATIDKVIISGSKVTKDRIIRRYITTLPGDKYSNIEILRSRHQLAKTGFVDERKLQIIPLPNVENKTTDIEYIIKEKVDLRASLSAGYGLYGWQGKFNVGLNNFSLRNLLKFKIPMGDAQAIDLGWEKSSRHSNWSVSFLDPWIGGRRPLQLRTSFNYLYQTREKKDETIKNSDPITSKDAFGSSDPKFIKGYKSYISTKGTSISLGKKLKWPEDTTVYGGITFNRHDFKEYNILNEKKREDGYSMDLIFNTSLKRDTTDSIFYPKKGHTAFIISKLTPPWSLFKKNKNPNKIVNSFSEFHQWKFGASISQKIVGNLVIFGKIETGLLGSYSRSFGPGPYKRYFLGGDGMIADYYNPILGQTDVKLRGYSDPSKDSFGMPESSGFFGGVIYDKFTFELRHPISLDFIIPIYLLVFFEAANTWADYSEFKFSEIWGYKSYGFGFRTVLPMLGPFGIDFGFGIDRENKQLNPEFHFALGMG